MTPSQPISDTGETERVTPESKLIAIRSTQYPELSVVRMTVDEEGNFNIHPEILLEFLDKFIPHECRALDINPDEIQNRAGWNEENIRWLITESTGSVYFLMDQDCVIIGGICFQDSVWNARVLSNLWIEPEYRGKGYGKWFVQTTIASEAELHPKRRRIELSCSLGMRTEWYKSLGFVPKQTVMFKPI
jgi:GNAT superfamily N-acetyltransferase